MLYKFIAKKYYGVYLKILMESLIKIGYLKMLSVVKEMISMCFNICIVHIELLIFYSYITNYI
jgi:hypothetical protein